MKRLFSLLLTLAIILPSCGSNPGSAGGSYTKDELWLQNGSNSSP